MIEACKPITVDPIELEKVVGRIKEGEAHLENAKRKIRQTSDKFQELQTKTKDLVEFLNSAHHRYNEGTSTDIGKANAAFQSAKSGISAPIWRELHENRKPYIEQVAKEFDEKLKTTKPIDAEEGGPEHIRQVLQKLPNVPKAVWKALGVHLDSEGHAFGKSLSKKGQKAIYDLFNNIV